MRGANAGRRWISAGILLAALSACGGGVRPPVSDAPLPPIASHPPIAVSHDQRANETYYQRYVDQQVARGLMRQDGGGPDTPFDIDDVLQSFEQLAFYDEYARSGTYDRSAPTQVTLARWETPIRFNLFYGHTVSQAEQRRLDSEIAAYTKRLHRLTQHPMTITQRGGNFDVLMMGHDDTPEIDAYFAERRGVIGPEAQRVIASMPRDIHCIVMAFSNAPSGAYSHAIAVIRTDTPDLLKTACIHEELAQGLGLANDSPRARPSIFNDDDEFATLTTMDGLMLEILYDDRLYSGMTLDQARPLLRQIGDDLNRPNS